MALRWQQIGDGILDGIAYLTLRAIEIAANYLGIILLGYGKLQLAVTDGTGENIQ